MYRDSDDYETVTLHDLLEDGRYDVAEQVLAQVPAEDPARAWAMSLRALCLAELEQADAALPLARAAVAHDPGQAFGHWVLGVLLCDRNRLAEAADSAAEAIRLDVQDARHHALVAQIHARKEEWPQCQAAAERGLAIDPEDEVCANLRALALRGTAGRVDWADAVEGLATQYPASSFARAGRGWSLLEVGNVRDARVDFEQALALDPTSQWARSGLIEAMKAENRVYDLLLRFFLWIERLPSRTRWIGILGGLFLVRALRQATRINPDLALFTYPVIGLWILFIVVSWTAAPLSDFVLARTAAGRRLVVGDRRLAGNLVVGLIAVALVGGISGSVLGLERMINFGVACAFLIIPTSAVFRCDAGWPRNTMAVYTATAALAAVIAAVASVEASRIALLIVIVMAALGTWVATFLASRVPAR